MEELESWWENVHNLQIDITSHCNARCAFCVRQEDGTTKTKEHLQLHHFNLDVWKRIASEDTRGLFIKELTLNGNWGDPMMHPDLVEMLDFWGKYHPETQLMLHTNGSMRTTQFWKDLAKVCRRFTNHVIVFAVDGMKDTHSIYRVRTNWDKICENIQAYTSEKGRARVCMTGFKHNIHQVKEVEQLAEKLGALEFELRPSHGAHTIQDGVTIEEVELESYQVVFNNDLRMSDIRDVELFDKVHDLIDKRNTACPWYNDRNIQIDPWARVWPCCHTSLYTHENRDEILKEFVEVSFKDARKHNDLTTQSLQEVLENGWYNINLYKAVTNGKWLECRKTCGVKRDG